MIKRYRWLFSALALVAVIGTTYGLVVALGGPRETPAGKPPTDSFPTLTLIQSGGFSGSTHTVVVHPDGSFQTTERVQGKDRTSTGQLTPADLQTVRRLATSPELAAEAHGRSGPSKCADTFIYSLRMGSLRVNGDQCDGADLGRPTLARLVQLLMH